MGALDLPVARWGNGLAVRISAQMARELNVTEGSVIHAEVVGPAQLRLASAKPFDARAFLDLDNESIGFANQRSFFDCFAGDNAFPFAFDLIQGEVAVGGLQLVFDFGIDGGVVEQRH